MLLYAACHGRRRGSLDSGPQIEILRRRHPFTSQPGVAYRFCCWQSRSIYRQRSAVASELCRTWPLSVSANMDRPDISVRSSGYAINRNACVDNRVIVSVNDLIVDDGCVVNLCHFPMCKAESAWIAVMKMIQWHKYEEVRAQAEAEVEAH